jgi:imidazolonepropionase-like amidohydrolase
MMRRAFALVLLVACGGGSSHPAAVAPPPGPAAPRIAAQPGDLAITHVTVVPMSSSDERADQTVIVRGDRIVAVALSESVTIPAGVTTIDGSRSWLLPGLTDMHVHAWSEDQLTLFLAAGVTTIRNMFGNDQHLVWRSQIAKGALQGPTIVTAGPIIDGDPPYWPGSAVLTDPAKADALVADQKAKGYDFLKPYTRLSKPAYEALAAAGVKYGMALEGHVPDAVGLQGVLAAKQKSVEHLDGWIVALVPDGVKLPEDRKAMMREAVAKADDARLPGLIAQTIAAGTWNCPTLVVLERIAALEDIDALKQRVKWLDMTPASVVAGWEPKRDFRLKSFTAEDYARIRAENVHLAKILQALAAANAPLLVGTDTGNPFVIPGAALHDELELMVAAGVPRGRVLRAATADAAVFLGTPHEFGVIEPGARADLLLVAVDPLVAPLPLVPDGVMVRGKWLPRAELETRLAAVARQNAAPPAAKDYWQGVAPLAPAGGKVIHEATYDLLVNDQKLGEERLAVTGAAGKRTIVGQEAFDAQGRIDIAYQVGPDAAAFSIALPFGKAQLAAKLTGGKLVATGADLHGKAVSLSEPLPKGGFVSSSGVGGALLLAERVASLKVGGKRTLAALELNSIPALGVYATSYAVERKPDASGNRVYAVATTVGKDTFTGDLVVDPQGFVVSQSAGPPLNLTFTRHAK